MAEAIPTPIAIVLHQLEHIFRIVTSPASASPGNYWFIKNHVDEYLQDEHGLTEPEQRDIIYRHAPQGQWIRASSRRQEFLDVMSRICTIVVEANHGLAEEDALERITDIVLAVEGVHVFADPNYGHATFKLPMP